LQWQWQSTVLGVCFLIFLVFTEQVVRHAAILETLTFFHLMYD
jgi:hypothetical protein